MPLPTCDRVIYGKNPLIEVICQLRFPSILRIDTETPAKFQDIIREKYPLYQEKYSKNALENFPPEVVKMLPPNWPSQQSQRQYIFTSKDESWTVTLSRDFLSLTTTKYTRWEEFKQQIENLIDALKKSYNPPFYSRIGLRYRDLIQPKNINLDGTPWSALLTDYVAGELAVPDIRANITRAIRQLEIKFDNDKGQVLINHGIATNPSTEELCYLIDSDYFIDSKMETSNAIEALNFFNKQAGYFFRWCITDTLHEAMEPTPV